MSKKTKSKKTAPRSLLHATPAEIAAFNHRDRPGFPTPTGLPLSAQGCAPRATLGSPPVAPPNPAGVASRLVHAISDETVTEIKTILNASIHELVFAMQHLGDDDSEDAQNCLTTVGMNVDRVQQMIVDAEAAIAAADKEAQ